MGAQDWASHAQGHSQSLDRPRDQGLIFLCLLIHSRDLGTGLEVLTCGKAAALLVFLGGAAGTGRPAQVVSESQSSFRSLAIRTSS